MGPAAGAVAVTTDARPAPSAVLQATCAHESETGWVRMFGPPAPLVFHDPAPHRDLTDHGDGRRQRGEYIER